MDLQLVRKSLIDYTRRNRRWVVLFAALGFSSYGAYKVYHSPSVARKRARISKVLGALVAIVEAVSDSAETVGVVSKDVKTFLESDSDQIPNSLKQVSKVVKSNELSQSVVSITQALTIGILKGHKSSMNANQNSGTHGDESSFLDKVFDKLSAPAGFGLVSVVVGSFARNLVMGFYQSEESGRGGFRSNSDVGGASAGDRVGSEMDSVERFVEVVCGDKCKALIGDCIQLFVSTAVAVYLDKTMHINFYNEIFAGLTNPKHEKQVKDVMISVCNGAIETLVKTSHDVLTKSDSTTYSILDSPYSAKDEGKETDDKIQNYFDDEEIFYIRQKPGKSFNESRNDGWAGKVSSTLAVPRNRRLVLHVTGRIAFETVRAFLELLLEKIYQGIRRCVDIVHETVVDGSLGVVHYVSSKTSVIATMSLRVLAHFGWCLDFDASLGSSTLFADKFASKILPYAVRN